MSLLALLAAGCGQQGAPATPDPAPSTTPAAPTLETLRLDRVLLPETLNAPTNLAQNAEGRLFVSEQEGRIWISGGEQLTAERISVSEPFDISDRVSSRGSEEGLLGLALDLNNDGHLYVHYSASGPRRSVISRYSYSPQTGRVLDDTELIIMEIEQPYSNHNGGQIAFGPEGYLYIGLGDGGSAGDPQGNGQDTSTLLGSILRIDVSDAEVGRTYAIPPDNPFADGGGSPEIWAYGLRNPWRFSFDRETGELWAGDVGQNRWEEIDLIERGGNYGWSVLEGSHCFNPRDNCDRQSGIPPVWEYSLDGRPCSVIGGYVYRGKSIPWLNGVYIYGDFCSGKVFGLRYNDGRVAEHKELADTGLAIMSFAEDNNGELYLLSQSEGIFRLAANP